VLWRYLTYQLPRTDNDPGLAEAQLVSGGQGFGFANMRERAKNLGAALDIQSKPGHGTTVIVRLRVPRNRDRKNDRLLDGTGSRPA
jgi:nitrate/nitrite-specific signal transduction histidine kinase